MIIFKHVCRYLAILALTLSVATAWGSGSYFSDRAAALELAQEGKHDAAAAEFWRLSESGLKERQKGDALFNAALCWQKAGQPDEAMKAAREISSPSLSLACQMELLAEGRKWKELLALSESEDFTTWPDRLMFSAYWNRARANQALGDLAAAEADLIFAGNATLSTRQKAQVALQLGSMCASQDSQKALDAYAEVCQMGARAGSHLLHARRARAVLFIERKQWPEALEEISLLKQEMNKDPYWISTGFLLTGRYHQAKGETAEAASNFDQASAVEKAPDELRRQAQKLKEELKKKAEGEG